MISFKNKTLLITGGGSGIGRAIACEFARRGTNVILTGRREDRLASVASECAAFGVKTYCKATDLESRESVDSLAEYVISNGLHPDFIVLNAGVSQRAATLETDFSVDRKLMEVNYFGSIYLIKALKSHLLSSERIHIGVVSSISGLFGFPLRSAYCASKHALFGFFESLALEYPHIKVTMLVPGRIRTDISLSAILADGRPSGQMDPGQANGMPVEKCARIAVDAIGRGKHQKLIGGTELLMAFFYRWMRPLYWALAGKVSAR